RQVWPRVEVGGHNAGHGTELGFRQRHPAKLDGGTILESPPRCQAEAGLIGLWSCGLLGVQCHVAAAYKASRHRGCRENNGWRTYWKNFLAEQIRRDAPVEIQEPANGNDLALERIGLSEEDELRRGIETAPARVPKRNGPDRVWTRNLLATHIRWRQCHPR